MLNINKRKLAKKDGVIAKTSFTRSQMTSDGVHYFFKLDQLKTNGANCLLVSIQDNATITNTVLGNVSIGANLMDSGVAGNRTLLYSTDWNIQPSTDNGSIFVAGFIPDSNFDISNLATDYPDLPFNNYSNLDSENNFIPAIQSDVIAPFIPDILDIIFRAPVVVNGAITARLVTQDGDVLNDAGWNENGWSGTGNNFIDHKADGRFHIPVMRFDISDIPAGATITSATIEWFWTGWSSGMDGDILYQASDEADCPTLSSSNNSVGWTKTTASVQETMPSSGVVNEQSFVTDDISSVIQELVDSYGGSLGEMGIAITPTGPNPSSDEVLSISDNSLGESVTPRITVTWTVAGLHDIDADITVYAMAI